MENVARGFSLSRSVPSLAAAAGDDDLTTLKFAGKLILLKELETLIKRMMKEPHEEVVRVRTDYSDFFWTINETAKEQIKKYKKIPLHNAVL